MAAGSGYVCTCCIIFNLMTKIWNLLAFAGPKANGLLSFSASIRFGLVVAVAFSSFESIGRGEVGRMRLKLSCGATLSAMRSNKTRNRSFRTSSSESSTSCDDYCLPPVAACSPWMKLLLRAVIKEHYYMFAGNTVPDGTNQPQTRVCKKYFVSFGLRTSGSPDYTEQTTVLLPANTLCVISRADSAANRY